MTEPVLITGGAGFIGCHLAAALLGAGRTVVVVDSLHPQVHRGAGLPVALPASATFVPGDVTSAELWRGLLRVHQPRVVVHLAAETGTGQSLTEATRHATANVVGTTQMLDAMAVAGLVPEQFVLASSRAVYGDGAWVDDDGGVHRPLGRSAEMLERGQWDYADATGRPLRPVPSSAASTAPMPVSVYGATKLTQEHVLACWAEAFGSAVTVLRLQNVFGPGQAVDNAYTGVLTFFAKQALAGSPLDVYEDGMIVRDFVHVADVVEAMTLAVGRPEPGVRTLDIGSGAPSTILAAAEAITKATGAPPLTISGRFRHGDVRAASCTIDEASARLDWAPTRPFDQHVDELLAWVGSQ